MRVPNLPGLDPNHSGTLASAEKHAAANVQESGALWPVACVGVSLDGLSLSSEAMPAVSERAVYTRQAGQLMPVESSEVV